ncbi:anchored repeat ABC transporter, substrate-binding protein [Corynebacterium lizhenjunii]|uniref:anchored repeat ABC transporter, substrate-binding protein n=1 Tax=Corynebacterium lizhenjunii TaxID=2709394 RepID=UPI001F40FF65|nr:anchored repeat ABC transporter, substrate-binding protein [Corynebacterium lizhenjunii]
MRSLCTALAGAALLLSGCAGPAPAEHEGVRIAATTPILADIARNVAGPDAQVDTLIPPGRDAHSFEPSLRTFRTVAHADIALANGLLLEPAGLMDAVREVAGGPVVEVADVASTRGAQLVPLVDNVALDAIWLGLRVTSGQPQEVWLESVSGPGAVAAYVVSTFGSPQVIFDSGDGVDPRRDRTQLPARAHTHVSWAFSQPGIYELRVGASGVRPATVRVAVGVTPPQARHVLDSGHIDITADAETGRVELRDGHAEYAVDDTVIAVPSSVYQPIPADAAYRFLGTPGADTYLLPQAVLGRHIHGEVDPHLWHNVANASLYAEVIAEELAQIDPSHGHDYRARAQRYREELGRIDAQVRAEIAGIAPQRRHLVTPHHGYAYLEQGYGVDQAGFVSPNPAVEPSPRDVIALRRTLDNLDVPAVFIEPTAEASAATLRQTAAQLGIAVCEIYGDTLDEHVPTYADLMLHNASQLRRCLSADNSPDNGPDNSPLDSPSTQKEPQ